MLTTIIHDALPASAYATPAQRETAAREIAVRVYRYILSDQGRWLAEADELLPLPISADEPEPPLKLGKAARRSGQGAVGRAGQPEQAELFGAQV